MIETAASIAQRVTLDISDSMDAQVHRVELELDSGRVYHAIVWSTAVREALIERLVDTGVKPQAAKDSSSAEKTRME